MKQPYQIWMIAGLVLLAPFLSRAETAQPPPAESREARDARMAWWREARFGMFVHWGLYSGLAGSWEGKQVATNGNVEGIQVKAKADAGTYARAALPLFKPKKDFALEWARLAKSAGCRYVVLTTKHHEGFALHDSKVTKAYLLADRRELKVEQTAGEVSLSLPAGAPDKIASVICVEIADKAAKVATQK